MFKVVVSTDGPVQSFEFRIKEFTNGRATGTTSRIWTDEQGVIHEFNPDHIIHIAYYPIEPKD